MIISSAMRKIFSLLLTLMSCHLSGQEFIFGHDLSYVNQMEDCGAVFKEEGTTKDVYSIFADHGSNLVRVRLWVDPSWWQDSLIQPEGVKPHYNDLDDVKETIRRARDAGMKVMLGMHYSDFWADPGRQLIPRAWLDVAYSLDDLKDSVYNYTVRVMTELEKEGLMPDFVKIGNENNGGFLRHIPEESGYEPIASVSNSWARHAQLFNAAIAAVRGVGDTASLDPKIVIHFSNQLSGQVWNYNNIISNGVTDFDVIGISYYYAWHGGSLKELENTIAALVNSFPDYEVMVAEMGYLWTTENFDSKGNIINEPDPEYLPVIPEKQLEYLVDYTRAVMRGGGMGVIFWEPAWVSTPCTTPWGTGSSHDHVVFFDPVHNNFMENGGGNWCDSGFYADLEAHKVIFKVNMEGVNTSDGVFISGSWNMDTLELYPMANEGNDIYSYFTYLPAGFEGTYFFHNDSAWSSVEPVPLDCRATGTGGRTIDVGPTGLTITCKWGACESAVLPTEVQVTFKVKMEEDADLSRGVFVVGEINDWVITGMDPEGNHIYSKSFLLPHGDDSLAYYYLTTGTWDNYKDYRESVPMECALKWGVDRVIIVPPRDTVVGHLWGSCLTIEEGVNQPTISNPLQNEYLVYPNPASGACFIRLPESSKLTRILLYSSQGVEIAVERSHPDISEVKLNLNDLVEGLYMIKIQQEHGSVIKKLVIGS